MTRSRPVLPRCSDEELRQLDSALVMDAMAYLREGCNVILSDEAARRLVRMHVNRIVAFFEARREAAIVSAGE